MAKVVVIGNSGVGKSSILARCQGESFAEETRPTIGIDFVTRKVPFSDDRYCTSSRQTPQKISMGSEVRLT